jgi:alpha-1,3-rhamnosyl/mannosyltransferase
LIEAFSILRAERKDWSELQLAIVGGWGWGRAHHVSWVDKSAIRGYVVTLGHVPEDEMVALYSGARLFVLPSLHEGFGLPLLEAMACGTPVICSNVCALPEVAGNAALFFDPTKPEEIADTARRVLDDTDLQASLIAEGQSRVRLFSAENMASATLTAYQRACAG